MIIKNERVVKRWDNVMYSLCLEHLTFNTSLSEIVYMKGYYGVQNCVTRAWMLAKAEYWLSCYYESGNCRCDDRFLGKEEYKSWRSEVGMLKRLIETLRKCENDVIIEWDE